jgi:mono/diheme cytochrome c family protein
VVLALPGHVRHEIDDGIHALDGGGPSSTGEQLLRTNGPERHATNYINGGSHMTRHAGRTLVLSLVMTMAAVAPSFAQADTGRGGAIFLLNCASCHGPQANGDGPIAANMQVKPPDLTRIAARNGGKFSEEMVSRVIDGRNPVKNHGGQGMPVWGDAFLRSNAVSAQVRTPDDVRQRIDALVKYLASIQQK